VLGVISAVAGLKVKEKRADVEDHLPFGNWEKTGQRGRENAVFGKVGYEGDAR
jgi:hypothetical protein